MTLSNTSFQGEGKQVSHPEGVLTLLELCGEGGIRARLVGQQRNGCTLGRHSIQSDYEEQSSQAEKSRGC